MFNLKVYLSNKYPRVIEYDIPGSAISGQYESDIPVVVDPLANPNNIEPEKDDRYIVTMHMTDRLVDAIVKSHHLKKIDNYTDAVWNKKPAEITWKRTVEELSSLSTKYFPSITISYTHPNDRWTPNPYWTHTIVEVKNPLKLNPHSPFIVEDSFQAIELGKAPNASGSANWNRLVKQTIINIIETQPIPRPGESILLRWEMNVASHYKSSIAAVVPYEIPQFTGGVIISKDNEGVNTTYTALIFGKTITDIMPCDFYDFVIGKWAYFMKPISSQLEDADYQQKFGSSQIKSDLLLAPPKYRLTHLNFKGPMNTEMAMDPFNSIDIDSSMQFNDSFDLKSYEGTIISVDHEHCSAVVRVNNDTKTLPIFYHCKSDSGIEGGSVAFKIDDKVIVENPANDESFTNAKIIGFIDELRPCEYGFVIVYSTESGHEAMAWDLATDSVLVDTDTLSNVWAKLNLIGIPEGTEAVMDTSLTDVWNVPVGTWVEHVGVIDVGKMYAGNDLGDFYNFEYSLPYPAEANYDVLGRLNYLEYDHGYCLHSTNIDPNQKTISDNVEPTTKSSYVWNFMAFAEKANFETEFISLTGNQWPMDTQVPPQPMRVIRYFHYWSPFFSAPFQGSDEYGIVTATKANLDTLKVEMADSWKDGEWEDGDIAKYFLTDYVSGVATNYKAGQILEESNHLVFEYYGVCPKFVDTYGDGQCDVVASPYRYELRIYENGVSKPEGLILDCIEAVNQARADMGVAPLLVNTALMRAAQVHAQDLASNFPSGTLSHTGSDGSNNFERARRQGYYSGLLDEDNFFKSFKNSGLQTVSENIASVPPSSVNIVEDIMQAWRESTAGHWENLMNPVLAETGMGMTINPEGWYIFVQTFGKIDFKWTGFSAFKSTKLEEYVNLYFTFDPTYESTRLPRIFLT